MPLPWEPHNPDALPRDPEDEEPGCILAAGCGLILILGAAMIPLFIRWAS